MNLIMINDGLPYCFRSMNFSWEKPIPPTETEPDDDEIEDDMEVLAGGVLNNTLTNRPADMRSRRELRFQ